VSIVGRWAELDAARPAASAPARAAARPAPLTPMAGQRCEFELEDADGRRRVVLQAVVPGRRYVVGKGETCDIRVNATYASRRHAELWLDNGAWWVADAGSTNGIRIEAAGGALDPDLGRSVIAAGEQPLALVEGARIVLSARAEGPANEYPWVALWLPPHPATRITPIAASSVAVPKTPLTAILAERPTELAFTLTAASSSGSRTLELRASALPVSVGRSRNQTLVIDRRHEGVSGHHLDIINLDDDGAQVEVHGDNGVLLNAAHHGPGTRLHWMPGQTLVLVGSPHDVPNCQLTLAREQRK
jgi:pSer/pThr/pTyr-binding forkhead associated (FHA) protein